MEQNSSELDLDLVTIGVLTALPKEHKACVAVFDPELKGREETKRATSGTFTCHLCEINSAKGLGRHVVAVTLLPQMGNNAAAIAANILLQHCENVRYLIMCGIAGAVPHPKNAEEHVRLGDIVVSGSKGVMQYDRGKQHDPLLPDIPNIQPNEAFSGFDFRFESRSPSAELLQVIGRMEGDESTMSRTKLRPWEEKTKAFLNQCDNKDAWKRPAISKDCLQDDPNEKPSFHPPDEKRRSVYKIRQPRVFHGAIGAANIVLADPARRNYLRDNFKIKAVEMEGSGIADVSWVSQIGYLVVRGTCDYCNRQKNQDWQNYAALIAACYTKSLIEQIPPQNPTGIRLTPASPSPESEALLSSSPKQEEMRAKTNVQPPPPSSTSQIQDDQDGSATHDINVEITGLELENSRPSSDSRAKSQAVANTLDDSIALIESLAKALHDKYEKGQTSDSLQLEQDLERRLRNFPQRGVKTRGAWALLARIEAKRQIGLKLQGKQTDPTRLKNLQEEASRDDV